MSTSRICTKFSIVILQINPVGFWDIQWEGMLRQSTQVRFQVEFLTLLMSRDLVLGIYPPSKLRLRVEKWLSQLGKSELKYYKTIDLIEKRIQQKNPQIKKGRANFIAQQLVRETKEGFELRVDPKHRWIHPYGFHLESIQEFWKRIEAKCLLVLAENSHWAEIFSDDPKEAESMLESRLATFPKNSERITIPRTGHMIHYENPERLATEILRFLG